MLRFSPRRSQKGNAQVAMLVWNTFRHDARVKKEAETLGRAGYQVVVHALHAPGVTERREVLERGVEVMRHGRAPGARQVMANGRRVSRSRIYLLRALFFSLLTQVAMVAAILRSRPEVVHAHDANTLPAGWLAARLLGVALVYDAHEISTAREGYGPVRGVVGGLEKQVLPRAAGVITTTDSRAKFFRRAYGIPRPLVLQNVPRVWRGAASQRIRRELSLEQPWPIILYQGGLQRGRGLETLVRAARQVPQAYFVFLGGGPQQDELARLAQEIGVEEQVKFIATVQLAELLDYTASADIGVQPIEATCLNHVTTDSNKLFEYLMAGLPVVASRLPEIRRVVVEHDVGLLFAPGSDKELATALLRLVTDPVLRARFAVNALEAATVLNWEAQEGRLAAMYKSITSGNGLGAAMSRS